MHKPSIYWALRTENPTFEEMTQLASELGINHFADELMTLGTMSKARILFKPLGVIQDFMQLLPYIDPARVDSIDFDITKKSEDEPNKACIITRIDLYKVDLIICSPWGQDIVYNILKVISPFFLCGLGDKLFLEGHRLMPEPEDTYEDAFLKVLNLTREVYPNLCKMGTERNKSTNIINNCSNILYLAHETYIDTPSYRKLQEIQKDPYIWRIERFLKKVDMYQPN